MFDLFLQPDSPEYKAACKLWELYLRTKNEFVQKGDAEEDDDDEEGHDNQANSELVSVGMRAAKRGGCNWMSADSERVKNHRVIFSLLNYAPKGISYASY